MQKKSGAGGKCKNQSIYRCSADYLFPFAALGCSARTNGSGRIARMKMQ
jgi:hypothetical protein